MEYKQLYKEALSRLDKLSDEDLERFLIVFNPENPPVRVKEGEHWLVTKTNGLLVAEKIGQVIKTTTVT